MGNSKCARELARLVATGERLSDEDLADIEDNWSTWSGDSERDDYLDSHAEDDVATLLAEVKRQREVGVSLPGGDRLLGAVAIYLEPGLEYSISHPHHEQDSFRVHVERAPVEWSKEPPTEEGQYWVWWGGTTGASIMHLEIDWQGDLADKHAGDGPRTPGELTRSCGTLWGPRLVPPEGPAAKE